MSVGVSPPVPDDSVREEVRAWARGRDLQAQAADLDRNPRFPRDVFRELGRANLLGLRIPSELGGRGLSLASAAGALFELAYRGGTMYAKLAIQPEFTSVLAERGSAELTARYFRPLLRGETLVGNQLTEPAAGSDLKGLATRAERDGDSYRISGTKTEAAFAADADAAVVYARTGAGDISAFLVPQDLPGIERTVVGDLGERWMRRGRVTYRDVLVPVANRIGEEGRALEYVRDELTRERALLAAIYLGVARAAWDAAVRHASERSTFGRPLWQHEAVGFSLVQDWARWDAAWAYAERTLRRADAGEPIDAEAALAKWLAVDVSLGILDRAVQFHGGQGYSDELPFGRHWRDVRSGALGHGPSEIMLRVAAGSLWGSGLSRRRGSPMWDPRTR
jgi:alkylation response protein AidB-like acyl-CoA dehydrogenase